VLSSLVIMALLSRNFEMRCDAKCVSHSPAAGSGVAAP
jgi:hypothetical protein